MRSGSRQIERFAHGITARYNEMTNGIRYNINSASMKYANTDTGLKIRQGLGNRVSPLSCDWEKSAELSFD